MIAVKPKLSFDTSALGSRAEAIQILGSQFYVVAMEITGGNTTLTADIDDIKARATSAFTESMRKVCLRFCEVLGCLSKY